MSASRLSLALETGAVHLPASGDIALYNPPAGTDLGALPASRLVIVHGNAPDHAYWSALGHRASTDAPDSAAGAIVFLPRAKSAARNLVARAVAHGGPVIVDGQKTDGVDSLLRDLRARTETGAAFAKAHGKCFSVSAPPAALADWILPDTQETPSGWVTAPGVFSADAPDPGSVALAAALPAVLKGRVADLGAGWGYLAYHVLQRPEVEECALVEAEHAALEAARRNVADPRARFHWADATRWSDAQPFDHVVTNPPFHSGRAATPALGAAFIATAAQLLAPRGTLWLVANRHLPYEAALTEHFNDVRPLEGPTAYKLYAAQRPRRVSRSRSRR
ncbi:MAG: methyltransferase [Pseudomonadota bacterium]